ncbi:MAG: hypothetical protein ACW980_22465 [Promethearchaeota archaeon]|jgi:hypothetical protein
MKKSKSRKNKEWRRRKALKDLQARNRDKDKDDKLKPEKELKPLTKAERREVVKRVTKRKDIFAYRSITQRKQAVKELDIKFAKISKGDK